MTADVSTPVAQNYRYVQVLVDLDAKALDRRTFSYAVTEEMAPALEIGMPVSVPFGRMKQITGYIVGFTNHVEPGIRVKDVTDVLDDQPLFDLDYLQFLDWTANYYATPLMTVLSAALPASLVQKTKREVILQPEALRPEYAYMLPRPAQKVLAFLKERPAGKGIRVRFVATQTGLPLKVVNQALYKLQQDGVVRLQSSTTGTTAAKTEKWLFLPEEAGPDDATLTARHREILDTLRQAGSSELRLKDAMVLCKATQPTLKKLADAGFFGIVDVPVNRDRLPLQYYHTLSKQREPLRLNSEQQAACDKLLAAEPGSEYLLYGVTGSGKTEVYMALTEAMLQAGKSVLILVPEISLTSHIARRFIERFGLEHIALWHSQLSAGEKVDAWRRIHQGELKIIIGARSAIFTPIRDVGLIVMDEEHEGSYKQDTPTPRYHAKTLARELIRRTGAKLLLGSATPDIETFYQARERDAVLPLTRRYGGRAMADVEVVDMRRAKAEGRSTIISASLQTALEETLAAEQQAILLLNRRGFFTLILCNECDTVFECPHCTVALTLHRFKNQVRCHYCGYEAPKPQFCPKCASMDLTFTGMGTQRLEEDVAEMLPDARILRLDSDVMQKKFAHRDIFEAFAAHEADILIGTQMVAKGLDVANVTLVGVIGADTAFSLPDYKASERGFQLLTQVAGRSGRGEKPGRVIIQSLQPNHPVILRAKDQDYAGFYEDELAHRGEFDFPPYSQLFRLMTSCPDEFRARNFLKAAAINLQQHLEDADVSPAAVTILGPAPCVIPRIQGRYRYHMMVKNRLGEPVHQLITRFYNQVQPPEDVNFLLDVDAQSFL